MAENEADDGAVPPELPPYTIDNHRASLNQLPDHFSLPATAMEGLDSVLAEDQASIFRVIQTILSTARAFLFICQTVRAPSPSPTTKSCVQIRSA